MNDYFIFGTLNQVWNCSRNVIQCMVDMALMPKLLEKSIFWVLEPYHLYIQSNLSFFWYIHCRIIECPKDEIIIPILSGLQRSQNHQISPKIGYFSHFFGIRAISTIHWIKFLIGTYMIQCPKDKVIIHRAFGVGYRVLSGLQRSQKS